MTHISHIMFLYYICHYIWVTPVVVGVYSLVHSCIYSALCLFIYTIPLFPPLSHCDKSVGLVLQHRSDFTLPFCLRARSLVCPSYPRSVEGKPGHAKGSKMGLVPISSKDVRYMLPLHGQAGKWRHNKFHHTDPCLYLISLQGAWLPFQSKL